MTKKLLLMALGLWATAFAAHTAAQTGDEGTTVTIAEEKFDAFTEGTEQEPGTTDISSFSSGKLDKELPGWSGRKVYEAGGKLKVDNGGYLQTARYDLSANDGMVKLTMKVKSLAAYGTAIDYRVGYNTAEQIMLPDDEWHTVSVILEKGNSSSYIRLAPYMVLEGFLIDELTIETSDQLIKAPEAKQPTKADGASFTATWSKVTNAKDYLVDVYSKDANGEKVYFTKDYAVSKTSAVLEGLNPGTTYYYTVRARKANGAVSDFSNEVEVVKVISKVDAPKVLPATNLTPTSFTANWEGVADATGYIVDLKKTETLAESRQATILSENFDKVDKGTLANVEFGKSEEYIDAYTELPGWYAVAHCYAKGYIGLSPYTGNEASITTPAVNLSAANGAFNLHVNMAETIYGKPTKDGQVTVTLYNGEEKVEEQTVTLEEGFKEYVLSFTKGTNNSFIEIAYNGSNKVFIDTLAVTQQLNEGDSFTTLVEKKETTDTHADFTVQPSAGNVVYAYSVQAEGRTVVDGEIASIVSETSAEQEVKLPLSAISQTQATGSLKAYVQDNHVVVVLPQADNIKVFAANGQQIATIAGKAGANTVAAPKGLLMITNGKETVKVVR